MGYHTDFEGSFQLSKPATEQQIAYLNRFSYTRRVKRDVTILKETQGGAYGLNDEYGVEGEFFVGECEKSINEINRTPSTQPGRWCDWVLTEDGTYRQWNGGEKFYNYVEWLEYLINNFFVKWGIELNGEVYWYGEDKDDLGKIEVENNKVTTKFGKIEYK